MFQLNYSKDVFNLIPDLNVDAIDLSLLSPPSRTPTQHNVGMKTPDAKRKPLHIRNTSADMRNSTRCVFNRYPTPVPHVMQSFCTTSQQHKRAMPIVQVKSATVRRIKSTIPSARKSQKLGRTENVTYLKGVQHLQSDVRDFHGIQKAKTRFAQQVKVTPSPPAQLDTAADEVSFRLPKWTSFRAQRQAINSTPLTSPVRRHAKRVHLTRSDQAVFVKHHLVF